MLYQFANFALSSLAAPISAGQEIITIANPASFPKLGNFPIVVQSFDVTTLLPTSAAELMLVTAVQGNQFTVQRGAENTQAIAFAAGANVANIITAKTMEDLQNGASPVGREIIAAGTVDMVATDGIIEINKTIAANTSVITPVAPTAFKPYTVKDGAGNADVHPITITPYSGLMDGAATYIINAPYGAVTFYWNNSNYSIQSVR